MFNKLFIETLYKTDFMHTFAKNRLQVPIQSLAQEFVSSVRSVSSVLWVLDQESRY